MDNIKFFDISLSKNNSIILIIGRRNSGKTILIKNIIKYKKNIDLCTIFDPKQKNNNEYNDLIIPNIKYYKYDENIIFNELKNNSEKQLIIFDNALLYSKKELLLICEKIILNNKINNTSFILSMSTTLTNSSVLIENIDYIFIFNDPNISHIRNIYYKYAIKIFSTFELFNEMYLLITENLHYCMVISKILKSNKIEDNIYYYRVNLNDNFKDYMYNLID